MKNILVTGVSRGLGLCVARTLLEKGYSVYGISSSISKEIEDLQKKYPQKYFWKKADLSINIDDLKKIVFDDFVNNSIPLFGLVNNAAFAYDDIITNLQSQPLEKMFKVNVFAPMMLTKYAIRNMLFNSTKGSIVHVSSISVHTGYKGLAMYAATKGAMEAFSKNTAREWGEKGIRSNCLVAGFMETDMSQGLTPEQKDRIYKRTALKSPTELLSVAQTIAFLLSDESASITGQNVNVDSGTI